MKFEPIEFAIAYWKRKWVCVPFFHLPQHSAQDIEKTRPFMPENYDPHAEIEEETRAYDNIHPRESIVPWLCDQHDLQELCNLNNIPIGWVLGRQVKKPVKRRKSYSRRDNRKILSLKGRQIQKILTSAKRLNRQHGVALKLLWHLNKLLCRGGDFVTLEEILRMQIREISSYNDNGCNWINLYRRGKSGGHIVAFCLPTYLWQAIRDQIDDNSVFLFSNKHGGPIHTLQVDKTLKHAASLVGIQETVTSLSLRPPSEKKRIERQAKKNRYDGPTSDHLKEVTLEGWNRICELIPEIHSSKGRKSKYPQLDLFNAILYYLRMRCPIRKLPDSFPHYQAVESQKRRWEKSGILQKILKHRGS